MATEFNPLKTNANRQGPTERPKRIPVSAPRNILTVSNPDPNYVYRIVNDTPGRIEKFLEGGWEIVKKDEAGELGDRVVDRGSRLGSAVTRLVGNTGRGPTVGVLMRIKREWYDEDQRKKQEQLNELEASMKRKSKADYGNLLITRK